MTQTNTQGARGTTTALVLGLLLAVLMSATMMLTAKPAHAAKTFTVNSTGDSSDRVFNDGLCDSSDLAGSQCTLRAAIQEANLSPGADTIDFGIPGDFVRTILPISQLPQIIETVTIDGYTQTGSSANTLAKGTNAVLKIQLDGSSAGDFSHGLVLGSGASNSVVKGLAINNFDGDGILVLGASGVRVEGNFVGTGASGTLDLGNGTSGVDVSGGGDNTVGGATPAARNLISGNGGDGVRVLGSVDNEVEGNLIGADKDATGPLGNTQDGVHIDNSKNNVVGGTTPGTANTIAFNDDAGVDVEVVGPDPSAANGNSILGNSIFANARLGVDLTGGIEDVNGRTLNDKKDADTGANNLQNKPAITSVVTSGGKTTVEGKLNSAPNTTYTVQFFRNPPGTDEGKKFVGQKSVTTDGSGKAKFAKAISPAVAAGQAVTATATDPLGNTSEFSVPRTVVAS